MLFHNVSSIAPGNAPASYDASCRSAIHLAGNILKGKACLGHD
jgi:hypothetical protein